MNARLDYNSSEVLQKFAKHLIAASAVVQQAGLPPATANLAPTRASQINGCSVCLDMHTKDAEHAGETSVRLNLVAAWRDAKGLHRRRAGRARADRAGHPDADGAGGVTDEAWANAAKHYDTDQLAALVCTIAMINTFNRLNVISQKRRRGLQARPVGLSSSGPCRDAPGEHPAQVEQEDGRRPGVRLHDCPQRGLVEAQHARAGRAGDHVDGPGGP